MKALLKKIRITALYILFYNLILILSIWLGKVSSKEEFMIAVAGNAVMMGLSFVHLHNQVSDEFHDKSKPPVELVVCSAAISHLFRPGPKAH